MNGAADTWLMLRLLARLERLTALIGLVGIVALVGVGTSSMDASYPTAADRLSYEAVSVTTTAAHALNGPPTALSELGGIVVFEIGWSLALGVAALSVVLVARNLRGAEERGRMELLLSGPMGPHATLVATLLLVGAVNTTIGIGVAGALTATGAGGEGALVFGASVAAVGVTFAAVTAVAAQVTERVRDTYGIAWAALGAAFALRAAGDAGALSWLSWASPLGWAQATRPYGGDRWWPLLISLSAVGLLTAAAQRLESRRDLGAGLIRPRPGPPTAPVGLSVPFGLARRLHRAPVRGWVAAAVGLGAAFGAVGADAGEVVSTSDGMSDLVAGFGAGSMEDAYFALVAVMMAIVAGAGGVAVVRRALAEEEAGRADMVLAGPVGPRRWLGSHLAIAALASGAVLVTGGGAMGLTHGLRTGDLAAVGRLTGAALAQLPAVWLVLAVALVLIGTVPRRSAAVWLVVAWSAVTSILGEALQLPSTLVRLSPFEHTPRLPSEELWVIGEGPAASLVGPSLLLVSGLVLASVGLLAFGHRNLT